MSEKKWHAVYTRTRWEKKVAELLEKKNFETYCPLNRVKRQWKDRKKFIFEPLFSSYVFIRADQSEYSALLQTAGVRSFVYWLGKPAIIKDSEIDTIKQFLNDHPKVTLEKTNVNVNDLVRIISGPLLEHEGNVVSVKSKTVKVVLPSMGYLMSAEVELDNVEVLVANLRYFENLKNVALGN